MKLVINISFAFLAILGTMQAQNCYIQESNFLGLDLSSNFQDLENKSCEVRDSLPLEFQNSFKVYSFGFYNLNRYMESGSSQVWEDYLNQISSPYYVAFGTELNNSNNKSQMYVKVQFPTTGIFECYSEVDKALIRNRFEQVLSDTYSLLGKSAFSYQTVEIEVLNLVLAEIVKAKGCCIPVNKSRNRSDFCPLCPESYDEISYLFTSNGYVEITIQDPVISSFIDTSSSVKHFSKIDGTLDGNSIDINNDVGDYLSKMSAKMEGIYGKILNFDPNDPDCQSVLGSLGIGSDENTALKGKSGGVRNGAEIVYSANVVSYVKSEDEASIFIKIDMDQNPTQGDTIFLQNLDGCCLEMEAVKDSLSKFYEALGNYPVIKPEYSNINDPKPFMFDNVALTPPILIASYLYAQQVKNNSLVLFGTGSQLVNKASIDYKDITLTFFNNNTNEVGDISRILRNTGLLEMGDKGGSLCLIRANLESWLEPYRCQSQEELAAFLTFHANGHNAGLDHEFIDPKSPGGWNNNAGYMSHGCCTVVRDLRHTTTVSCGFCVEGDKTYLSLLDYVQKTSLEPQYDYIKKAIYERFIK